MIGRSLWVVLGLMLAAASPVSLSGQARVVDGDTFTLGAERVRMWGIDAPEGRQTCKDAGGGDYLCGEVARERLVGLIARRNVTCEVRNRDQYGRAVARCRAGDLDLGLEMVKGGWALEYRQFSGGAYTAAETEARRARRGVWAGAFERPSEWRAAERSVAAPATRRADRERRMCDQGQHQLRRTADIPCARPGGLCRDADRPVARRALVLHNGGGAGGWMDGC